jgi:hypothetical protein
MVKLFTVKVKDTKEFNMFNDDDTFANERAIQDHEEWTNAQDDLSQVEELDGELGGESAQPRSLSNKI